MYPIALLNNPPPPAYPEYPALLEQARRATPAFVDPANLHPERPVVERRGYDWCTAVLGRPYGWTTRISVVEQYLLIEADRAGVDPPLPGWIVEGLQAAAEREAEQRRRVEAARQRDRDAWAAARSAATVELDVYFNTTARVRHGRSEYLGHAVPRVDVYSGARASRTHRAGRALCELPNRARPLALNSSPEPDGTPATCVRCLEWTPKVRPTSERNPR